MCRSAMTKIDRYMRVSSVRFGNLPRTYLFLTSFSHKQARAIRSAPPWRLGVGPFTSVISSHEPSAGRCAFELFYVGTRTRPRALRQGTISCPRGAQFLLDCRPLRSGTTLAGALASQTISRLEMFCPNETVTWNRCVLRSQLAHKSTKSTRW